LREIAITDDLLDWYDTHARVMPWRVMPADRKAGARPDPYSVWLSEVMLQQTTVAAVKDYHRKFMSIWPTVSDLAAADDADVMAAWAGLGYYARARNLLKCAREVVSQHQGHFPETYDALLTLPGIGPYNGLCVQSYLENAARRLRPSGHGSGRDHLHPKVTGLRNLSRSPKVRCPQGRDGCGTPQKTCKKTEAYSTWNRLYRPT